MIIRSEQLEAFQPLADAAFLDQVVEHLLRRQADVTVKILNRSIDVADISRETLYEMVRNGIARGRSYDITWESTLTAFVALMFSAAPNFDEHPLIRQVLKDTAVEPDQRLDELWERTSEEDWEAVERNYNPGAWSIESAEEITTT